MMNIKVQHYNQYHFGLTLAFGALLLSGTFNALAKGLTPYLSPMSLLIIIEALTAFFIILTFGLVTLCKAIGKLDRKTLAIAVIVGLFNSVAGPLLWFYGLTKTSAVNASMLSCANIIIVLLASGWFLREKMNRRQAMGAGIVFAGLLFINLSARNETMAMHMGDLFVLAGATMFGFGEVLFKKYLSHVMPELAIFIRNIVGVAVVMSISLLLQHSFIGEFAAFPAQQVLLLLAFAFFSRYLNLTLFYEALNRIPVTTLSFIEVAKPFSGMLFAVLILGEKIEQYHFLGGLIIVFGLLYEQTSGQTFRLYDYRRWLPGLYFHKNTQTRDAIILHHQV